MKPAGLPLRLFQPFTCPLMEPSGDGGAIGEEAGFEGGFPGDARPGVLAVTLLAGLERECGGEGAALGRLLLALLLLASPLLPAGFAEKVGKGKVVFGGQVFCAGIVEAGEAGPTGTCVGRGPQLCWLKEREGGTGSGPE